MTRIRQHGSEQGETQGLGDERVSGCWGWEEGGCVIGLPTTLARSDRKPIIGEEIGTCWGPKAMGLEGAASKPWLSTTK